jgi:hypothetical protein
MKRHALLSQNQSFTPTTYDNDPNTDAHSMALKNISTSISGTAQILHNKPVKQLLVLPNFDGDLPTNVLTPGDKNMEILIKENQQPLSLLDRVAAMRLLNSVRKELVVATVTFPTESECVRFHRENSNNSLADTPYCNQLETREPADVWRNVEHSGLCLGCMSSATVHYTTMLPVRLNASIDKQDGVK